MVPSEPEIVASYDLNNRPDSTNSMRVAASRRCASSNERHGHMIEVRDVTKRYGSLVALDRVNVSAATGTITGLLGPNGAGKTTLVHIIAGILPPDAGMVRVCGRDPLAAATRARIGLAPQEIALYEDLTGRQTLHFFARLYGVSGRQVRACVDEALQLVGLSDRADHRVGTYSGGMKRRLSLACALIHDPEVLLLDEPTVGVDPQSRRYLLELVRKLADEGRTVIYSTHYMEEAQRLCDRIVILDRGKVLATGTLDELLSQYGGAYRVVIRLAEPEAAPNQEPKRVIETTEPARTIEELVKAGLAFEQIQLFPPDLETAFLKLTGRSLRDE